MSFPSPVVIDRDAVDGQTAIASGIITINASDGILLPYNQWRVSILVPASVAYTGIVVGFSNRISAADSIGVDIGSQSFERLYKDIGRLVSEQVFFSDPGFGPVPIYYEETSYVPSRRENRGAADFRGQASQRRRRRDLVNRIRQQAKIPVDRSTSKRNIDNSTGRN